MTNNSHPTPASVEQVDREAAARWAKSNSRHMQAANILRGSCDTAPLVQAFARHRAQAEGRVVIPKGWKLVPVEPTEAMLNAGAPQGDNWWDDECPQFVWQRMLTATPEPPTPAPADPADQVRRIEILRRALAWHGDPQRMATTREEWQQEIDAAIAWVKQNPEPDRPSFSSFSASAPPAETAGDVEGLVRIALWNVAKMYRATDAGAYAAIEEEIPPIVAALAQSSALREAEELRAVISDPAAVHINMLRGRIAKPSPANIWHLYGDALAEAMPKSARTALAKGAGGE